MKGESIIIIIVIVIVIGGGVERYILTSSSYGLEIKENCESGSRKV